MTSPQEDLTLIPTLPIYTRGTSPATEWDVSSTQQTANAEAFISQVQQMQRDIIAERAEAAERLGLSMPTPYDQLLQVLNRADALVRDEMCSDAYRRVWERRWQSTAQFWDSGNLRRIGERMCDLVGLLRECGMQAERLSDFIAETRSELPV